MKKEKGTKSGRTCAKYAPRRVAGCRTNSRPKAAAAAASLVKAALTTLGPRAALAPSGSMASEQRRDAVLHHRQLRRLGRVLQRLLVSASGSSG